MCRNCVETEGGFEVEVTPEMIRVGKLIDGLYDQYSCGDGGPLHVLVTDYNVDDKSLDFCVEQCRDLASWSTEPLVSVLGLAIIDGLRPLSPAERSRAIWEATGRPNELLRDLA